MKKVGTFDDSASIASGVATFALFRLTENSNSTITFLSSLKADDREKTAVSNIMVQSTASLSNTNISRSCSPILFMQIHTPSIFSYNNFENCYVITRTETTWVSLANISYTNYIRNRILHTGSHENANIRSGSNDNLVDTTYITNCCFFINEVNYIVYSLNPFVCSNCYVDTGRFHGADEIITLHIASTVVMEVLSTGAIVSRNFATLTSSKTLTTKSVKTFNPEPMKPSPPANIATPQPTNTDNSKNIAAKYDSSQNFNNALIFITSIAAIAIISSVIIWFVVKCAKIRRIKKSKSQRLLKSDDEEKQTESKHKDTKRLLKSDDEEKQTKPKHKDTKRLLKSDDEDKQTKSKHKDTKRLLKSDDEQKQKETKSKDTKRHQDKNNNKSTKNVAAQPVKASEAKEEETDSDFSVKIETDDSD